MPDNPSFNGRSGVSKRDSPSPFGLRLAVTSVSLTVALTLAACSDENDATSASAAPPLEPLAAAVDYGADAVEGFDGPPLLDVWATEGVDNAPVMVVLHGVPVDRSITADLSAELAGRGHVVFNAGWQLVESDPSFATGADFHIACAVRFARANAAEYGGDPERVVLVGYSAGGGGAAAVSLNGDAITGQCASDESLSAIPDGLIALAGLFDALELESPSGLGRLVFEQDPAVWETHNPYEHLDQADGLPALLIHGDRDRVVPLSTSERFAEELAANGAEVTFEVFEGADHAISFDPWLGRIGDLIDSWLPQD